MELKGDGFWVRSIQPFDDKCYLAIFGNSEVAKYDDFVPITESDLPGEMERIALYNSQSKFVEYAVAILPENRMVGIITVEKKRKYAYLGYHFNPLFHGKGLAYRSVALFLSALPKGVADVLRLVSHPENKASLALAKKLGFVLVRLRKSPNGPELVFRYQP
jgi:RimJ/RimL family protein N-acetyltransferase